MLITIYRVSWAVFAIAIIGLMLAGQFTGWTMVTAGFIAFGLTFMGMIAVLPFMVTHPAKDPGSHPRTSVGDYLSRMRERWTPVDKSMGTLEYHRLTVRQKH